MKITRNRHLHILNALLEAEKPLSSNELANRSDSSIRTVKQDIIELNSELAKDGAARILSLKSKGYQIEILDAEKYQSLKTRISVMMVLYQKISIESMNRSLYILQRLLTDEYINMDELSDFFYLSKASLRDDFRRSVQFLDSYDIKVESMGKGDYRIFGKEQDIRQAMVEVHCSQYHDFEPLYPYPRFNEQFYTEKEEYSHLRHAMMKIVRESRITLTDLGTKKVATGLALSLRRRKLGRHPDIDPLLAEKIRETYDYSLARNIFRMAIGDDSAEESELLNLARMMLCFRDVDLRYGSNPVLPDYLLRQNHVLYEGVKQYMSKNIARALYSTDMFYIFDKSFESMQLQIFLNHFFDSTKRFRIITYAEQEVILTSPMSIDLARLNILQLENLIQEKIRDSSVTSYALLYEELMQRISLKYNRMRLAVTSTQGLTYAQLVKRSLLEHFSAYIRTAEVYNLYELRRYDFSQFDCVVMTDLVLYYVYPVKLARYRPLELGNNTQRLFKEVFAEGFDRTYFETIKRITRIHRNVSVQSGMAFLEALSYRYGKDDESQQKLLESFLDRERMFSQLVSSTGILLTFLPHQYTGQEFIDILEPSQAVSYETFQKINVIVCVSIRRDTDLADKKLLDSILQHLIYNSSNMDALLENSDKTYDAIFEQVILEAFHS